MRPTIAIFAALALTASAKAAGAAQVCAWMDETAGPDNLRQVKLWLQSDSAVDFTYELGGDGLADASGKMHSPSSGSFHLDAGQTDSPWSFGATLVPPGRIDVTVTLHAPTPSIFDPPGPVIALYTFRRQIPDGETKIPPALAQHQCVSIAPKS